MTIVITNMNHKRKMSNNGDNGSHNNCITVAIVGESEGYLNCLSFLGLRALSGSQFTGEKGSTGFESSRTVKLFRLEAWRNSCGIAGSAFRCTLRILHPHPIVQQNQHLLCRSASMAA